MLLSFSQAFKDIGRQVPTRSSLEWSDKIDNVFIFFSAEIDDQSYFNHRIDIVHDIKSKIRMIEMMTRHKKKEVW